MRVPKFILLIAGLAAAAALLAGPPIAGAVTYGVAALLVAAAWRWPHERRPALAATGVLLVVASLRPVWGEARVRDQHYGFSLTSVVQLSNPTPPDSAPSCSWLTGRGREGLCAPDPRRPRRFFLLATAPALLWLAILLGAAAAAPHRYPGVRSVLAMATSFAALGVFMVLLNEGAALAAFRNADLQFGGPGLVHSVLGAGALLAATLVTPRTRPQG